MARQRQYGDPISIPFTFETKERIERLAEQYDLAQADIVRDALTGKGIDELEKQLQAQKAAS